MKLIYILIFSLTISFSTNTALGNQKQKITELACLSSAIYYESVGEPYAGKVAVGQVILERIKNPLYPNSVCTVISENQQFQWFNNQKLPIKVFDETKEIAEGVLAGNKQLRVVQGATHFHNLTVKPDWAKRMVHMATIGNHKFYKNKNNDRR